MDPKTRDIVTSQTPRRIFKILLTKQRPVRKQELVEKIDLSRNGINYRLKQLKELDLIEIEAGKRSSYVELTEQGQIVAKWLFPEIKRRDS